MLKELTSRVYLLILGEGLYLQWNLSYPGSLVPTTVRILEMSVTENCMP